MPANTETPGLTQQSTTSGGVVGSLLGAIGNLAGVTLASLGKVYADGEVAKLQAKNDLAVQQLYTDAARQNYGPNDASDANRQAAEQTLLLFGFLPVNKSAAPFVGVGLALLGALLIVGIFRAIRK